MACGVLTALVVSGSLVSVSLADQKADVARVEQELRAEEEATAIHNRAMARAIKAVKMSSLARKLQQVEVEWAKFKRGEEVNEPVSPLREKRIFYETKMSRYIKRMTRIFLDDEIKRAIDKKLEGLTRELKKIRKKDYAHI